MRYYNSSTGRFVSKDPIGFLGGDISFYRYVNNDPINFFDPSGLKVDYSLYILSNKKVKEELELINSHLIAQGFPDNSFVIEVTGGDSLIIDGIVRSSTNGQPIVDSFGTSRAFNSAHNIINGARAVDVKFSGIPSVQTFLDAVSSSQFIPGSSNYSDGHIHLRLPRPNSTNAYDSYSQRSQSCGK
ncbi:MAG: hypothetical protein BM556_11455 [Bacteriovorax sp. MedPE-SWde]|nr:MAG: hypothetical protein BM556_11455 [Bacteriovorax sp. MedPE-SWde]